MAELSASRNTRKVPKVDLTAMVDLAFLLITFFMLTTSLSKPIAMDMAKPDPGDNWTELPASRTMTILLGKHNKVAWYMGESGKNEPTLEGFQQIRNTILANKASVLAAHGGDASKTLIIVIKPTAGASYQNFVDIMDELNVAKITSAPLIDDDNITVEERAYMKLKDI